MTKVIRTSKVGCEVSDAVQLASCLREKLLAKADPGETLEVNQVLMHLKNTMPRNSVVDGVFKAKGGTQIATSESILRDRERIDELKEEVARLESELKQKQQDEYSLRRDFMKEKQNLRAALQMVGEPINESHKQSVKLTFNVHLFDDLKGLDKGVVDLIKEKMNRV